MRVRDFQFVTIIAIAAACALAIAKGWDIVRFRVAQISAHDLAEAMTPWTSISGLASSALDAVVSAPLDPINEQTLASRLDRLGALLSLRPASSQHWLSLSAMRHLAGQPIEKLLGPLRLSFSTGRNEG